MVYISYQMDGCSLTTFPAGTIGGIVFPTADVKCLCGDTLSNVLSKDLGDYVYVQCATGVENLLVASGPTPSHGPQLIKHAVASTSTYVPPTTTQLVQDAEVNATTSTAPTTTEYFADGCSLATYPAGTIDGIVFPTADVKCACGDNSTVMAGITEWNKSGTAYTSCLTPMSSATVRPATATPAKIAASGVGSGSFSATAGANKEKGGSLFNAQTGGSRGKMGFGAMLAAVLALGATFALV